MIDIIRKRREDEGFTLIELMVVVLIIAILIAIAIPTFLGARKRAQDRGAQSNVRNGFTAEKVHYTDNQSYSTVVADLAAIEPSLTFVNSEAVETATANNVLVHIDAATDPDTLYMSVQSKSGSCFYLKDDGASATQYTKDTDGTCATASLVTGYSTTSW
jgi:type IV pilus assembly protein PilA